MHAADANARELLGTLGYFAPTIAIELREAAAPQPPYAVTITVEPGPQTRVTGRHPPDRRAETEPDAACASCSG